jgi:DNA-directed RNA polymerase I subunit RPA2
MQERTEQDVQKGRKTDIATQLYVFSDAHIRSFNFFLEDGLELICKHLSPLEIFASQIRNPNKPGEAAAAPFETMKIWFENLVIGYPSKFDQLSREDNRVFPWEARISQGSYSAPLMATICRVE